MQFSVSDVATNVAKRLSNWQKVGLENVFCEAVLILATAEYLKEPCGYQIAAEAQACNLFPGIGTKPGEINYDLHSTKENHKIIWEMKFLKKPNDQRIIYDLAKLALPEAVSDCQRFFLVAANGRARSNLVDRMNAAHSYTFDIIRDTEHELVCRSMPAVFQTPIFTIPYHNKFTSSSLACAYQGSGRFIRAGITTWVCTCPSYAAG